MRVERIAWRLEGSGRGARECASVLFSVLRSAGMRGREGQGECEWVGAGGGYGWWVGGSRGGWDDMRRRGEEGSGEDGVEPRKRVCVETGGMSSVYTKKRKEAH
jgi:hypothetical protein